MSRRSGASPAASGCARDLATVAAAASRRPSTIRGAGAAAGARPRSRCRAPRRACGSASVAARPRRPTTAKGKPMPERAGQGRSRSTACRSISSARPATRSPSTSSSSPIAGASRSATSIPSATPQFLAAAARRRSSRSASARTRRCSSNDDRVFCRLRPAARLLQPSRKVPRLQAERPAQAAAQIDAPAFDLLFEFDQPRAAARTRSCSPAMFALYAVPVANLFEMNCSRMPVRRNEHEHHVVPDRSRWLDFEAHRIVDVFAHYPGRKDKVPVFPLYSLPTEQRPLVRRALLHRAPAAAPPHRRGAPLRRARAPMSAPSCSCRSCEPADIDDAERVRELSVRALASNRHLTDQLPVGEAGADFYPGRRHVGAAALHRRADAAARIARPHGAEDARRRRRSARPCGS